MQYDTGSPIYKAVTSQPMSCDVNDRVKGVLVSSVAAFHPNFPDLDIINTGTIQGGSMDLVNTGTIQGGSKRGPG